jgi:hypothetical protein
MAIHHPDNLAKFNAGWYHLPAARKLLWKQQGLRHRNGSGPIDYDNTSPHLLPEWNGWHNFVQETFSTNLENADRHIEHCKIELQMELSGLTAWEFPDVVPVKDPHLNMPETGDMELALRAYWIMKQSQALCELRMFLANEEDWAALWEHLMNWWDMNDVYRRPPSVQEREMLRHRWSESDGR